MALAETDKVRGHFENIEYKNQAHSHFCSFAFYRQLPYFPEAKLSSTFLPSIFRKNSKTFQQQPENFQRLFISNPKIFEDFFACKIVLAANHQQPENIQRLFRLQNCLSRKSSISRKYSKTFQPAATSSSNQQKQPAAATSKSNQQQQPAAATSSSDEQQQPAAAISSSDQQAQPAAATSSSNQQQQPAAATSSSNQQQQPAAATSSNNQQQQSAYVLPATPTQSTTTSVSYNYGS